MEHDHHCVVVKGQGLSFADLIAVARKGAEVVLDPEVRDTIINSRRAVEKMIEENRVVYGVTTGFGKFSEISISPEEAAALQTNLLVSHACGVGEPLPEDVVRGMLLLRVNSLIQGFSGIRLQTIEALIALLNKRIHPIVPEKGSLGSSGDLCPLSHLMLPLLGLGEAVYQGELMTGAEALERAGLQPITLAAKEGLALNNGTQCMTAIGALAVHDAMELLELAELAASMSLEALNGLIAAFDERIHLLRGQKGQVVSAKRIRTLTEGSTYLSQPPHARVQDAYALRCTAQVHGASRDAIDYVASVVEREMNAVTDNPLIFADSDEAISGGNFHGEPIALAMDFLGIALSELANISERRLERMVNPALSNGLPPFLTTQSGLHSGFMIVQYSAAALVSENKVLAHPASVDSIPSSANQEDHVSMGTIAARKARSILENARQVLAMEMLTSALALDLREQATMGTATKQAYARIRQDVTPMLLDRVIAPDIAAVAKMTQDGTLYAIVKSCIEL